MHTSRIILVLFCLLLLSAMGISSSVCKADDSKPVIALIAFGTSVPEAQKSFEDIDKAFTKAFPGSEIHWAFTAQFIIDKLAEEGQTTLFDRKVPILNPGQLFKKLSKEGVKDVFVQSLHVVPGGEYTEVVESNASGLKLTFGSPLLGSDKDIAEVAGILSKEFGGADEYTILAGHGNDHHADYNGQLIKFNDYIKANYKNVQLATVEGPIGTETAFIAVKDSGLDKVKFIPFMIVAGDHIMNDVMGDEEDSWRSILGLDTTVTGPLGQNPEITKVFISHLKAVMPE